MATQLAMADGRKLTSTMGLMPVSTGPMNGVGKKMSGGSGGTSGAGRVV